MSDKYYISFIVATRNDDHGENMKQKNQFFIDLWLKKIKEFNLNAELIIVEWNPDLKEKPLKDVIKINDNENLKRIKIITVDKKLHDTFESSDKLNFYQMAAKNVGIRRSNGEFILCTNIDIIFSDKIYAFLAKENLKKKVIYRCDRYDINFDNFNNLELKDENYIEKLICINSLNFSLNIKKNKKYFVYPSISSLINNSKNMKSFNILNLLIILFHRHKKKIGVKKINLRKPSLRNIKKRIFTPLKINFFEFIKLVNNIFLNFTLTFLYYLFYIIFTFTHKKLHTNACGDFTLLDKKSWFDLKGYYEFDGYSWHVDSIFLWKAYFEKIKFRNLKHKIFHIEHSIGSGYNPGTDNLFIRLKKDNISYINDKELQNFIINKETNKFINDNDRWGFKDKYLETTNL